MANIIDLQIAMKYMANDNRYQYGRWNTYGNNTASNPSDGYHYDCGTALTWCIRDALNGHQHDNTPFSTYIWPNNDGSAYFDAYLLNRGFKRYKFDHQKALASGYPVVPVVGSSHVWAYYDTSQNLQFEANDGYGSGAASIDIHKTIVYSDSKYMYFPEAWENTKPNGLQDQPEADGRWAYYTNGKVDTSVTTVAQNINGWWYVKNGYVDFSYWGLAQNDYGWWVIEGGKVNFDAATGFYGNEYGWWWCEGGCVQFGKNTLVLDAYDGSWKYVRGGRWEPEYNGITQNEYGIWRVVNGVVDFTDGTYQLPIRVVGGHVAVDPAEQ